VVSGSTVYVEEIFTTIGDSARNRIAALSGSTGKATSWNPKADDGVYTLAITVQQCMRVEGFVTL